MALTPGTTFGSYAVVGLIGQGGMGEVRSETPLHRDLSEIFIVVQAAVPTPVARRHHIRRLPTKCTVTPSPVM